jgi:hypothetical protein
MPKQDLTGKAGYIKVGGSTGTKVNITKWSASVDIKMADTTDSADYDASTALIWNTQLPASAKIGVDIEGNYDLNGAQASLISATLNGSSPTVIAELGLTASAVFGYGTFNISNLKIDLPIEDTVTFTCTLVSNGKWNQGVSAP